MAITTMVLTGWMFKRMDLVVMITRRNSPTLDYWDTIFAAFIDGDTTQVDSLLQDSLQSFFYELVIFQDTVYNKPSTSLESNSIQAI